jgi:uncharacterized membrane protein YgdD (TMEM256/DUF423 family)
MAIGACLVALSVAAGAFGAHLLEARLDVESLATWETGSRYLGLAGFATWLIALSRGPRLAAWLVAGGGVVFFATLAILAIGGPRFFGAITPVGGAGMIVGLAIFAFDRALGRARAKESAL